MISLILLIAGIFCMIVGTWHERVHKGNPSWVIRWLGVWYFLYGMGLVIGVMYETGMT